MMVETPSAPDAGPAGVKNPSSTELRLAPAGVSLRRGCHLGKFMNAELNLCWMMDLSLTHRIHVWYIC